MTEKSMFLGLFYDECFDTLMQPLLSLPEVRVVNSVPNFASSELSL